MEDLVQAGGDGDPGAIRRVELQWRSQRLWGEVEVQEQECGIRRAANASLVPSRPSPLPPRDSPSTRFAVLLPPLLQGLKEGELTREINADFREGAGELLMEYRRVKPAGVTDKQVRWGGRRRAPPAGLPPPL